MSLAVILEIALSLSLAQGSGQTSAILHLQEETKPAAQEPAQARPEAEKPQEPAPPQAEAPNENQSAQPPAEAAPPKPAPAKPVAKPSATTARKVRRKRTAKPKAVDSSAPPKVVVRNGSTTDPQVQISSGGRQQAAQQLSNTSSLLDATTANLKKIAERQLAPAQQDMVKQIHTYMEQSKAASNIGDLQGAHNLAFKAHLLSEELLKR